jgi:hypothetical protein
MPTIPTNLLPPTLADSDGWVIVAAFGTVWLLLSYGYKTARTIARERTRREIAAYIAEGTMTPEQGERLMKAGETPGQA